MTIDDLRLALDVGPVRAQPAGVGMYAASVARELVALGGVRALIGVRREAAALDGLDRAGVVRAPFRSRSYQSWIQMHADRDARRAGARLVHYTNAAAPLVARLPFVLTVHDLSLLRMPRSHPLPRLAAAPVSVWSVARARAIIVPSEFTRDELARALRLAVRRVAVIHHAPADDPGSGADGGAATLARHGLTAGEYVIAVGTVEPRKNLSRLVAAFETLAAELASERPSMRLVVAGAPGWHHQPIHQRIDASPLRERIVVTGYLSPRELADLTRFSAVAAYVSIYEGFGMPVLDAMALGAPVVTADRTAMPEAAGGAAVLVDPYDVRDIVRGLRAALADRDRLATAGRGRAARRAWRDVALEHLDVYRWALRARR